MPRLYVIPLGFQVDYVVRFLVRVGIGGGDAVLALIPEQSGGGDERSKSEKALRDLGDFLRRIGGELRVMLEYISTSDPTNLVISVFDAIMKYANDYESVVIAITGGVRALSAVSPLVTAMLRVVINKEVRLFVVSENLVDYLDLTETLSAFNVVELSEGLINVLRALHEFEGSGRCAGLMRWLRGSIRTHQRLGGNYTSLRIRARDQLRRFETQVLLLNEPWQDIGEALRGLTKPSEGAVTAFTRITHPLGILSLVMISLNSFTTSANADLRVGVNLMTM